MWCMSDSRSQEIINVAGGQRHSRSSLGTPEGRASRLPFYYAPYFSYVVMSWDRRLLSIPLWVVVHSMYSYLCKDTCQMPVYQMSRSKLTRRHSIISTSSGQSDSAVIRCPHEDTISTSVSRLARAERERARKEDGNAAMTRWLQR